MINFHVIPKENNARQILGVTKDALWSAKTKTKSYGKKANQKSETEQKAGLNKVTMQ